jgi:hypothetical protein
MHKPRRNVTLAIDTIAAADYGIEIAGLRRATIGVAACDNLWTPAQLQKGVLIWRRCRGNRHFWRQGEASR